MIKPFSIVKAILVMGCVLSFFISSAQDYYESPQARGKLFKNEPYPSNKKFSIAISVGSATPLKSFSSTNVKNSFWDFHSVDSVKLQGFAKTGIHFNITASYLFSDGIGIMLMIGSNSNSFDINTFSSTVGIPFTTSEGYQTREYLIGPYISFSEWPKFTFEANAMVGLVTANYPAIALTIVDTTETIAFNSGKSFGYSFGGAVKYSITSKIEISINAAYTQTTMVYPGWTDTYTIPGYYPYVISHANDVANMPMGILKITAGVVFRLY